MKSNVQKNLLYDLSEVLKKYSLQEYSPEIVVEILSRSLSRKPRTQKEYVENKISPFEILKEQRKRMLYSLNKLSTLTGIPKSNLSAMENGKRPIGVKMAKVLSMALEIHYKVLL